MSRFRRFAAALLLPFAAPALAAGAGSGADPRIDLRFDASQAEATLALVEANASGRPVGEELWRRLFATEPYRRLAAREASLGRSFGEAEFRRFALAPELAARAPALARTLAGWRAADLGTAAERALGYLPAEARIRATVYPVVKPRDNSFVFETTTDPAIFLYLDPEQSAAAFANTVAHELHHIGLASLSAAYEQRIRELPADSRRAAEWLGALGEGVAVLAAAGSTEVHPMAAFGEPDRIRWDQDTKAVDQQLAQLDQFLRDLASGGFARPEVADHVAFGFFGYRGPWYTVGYRVAEVVERRFGRPALVEALADPRRLLARYNQAAAERNAAGESLALWSAELLAALGAP